MTVIAFQPELVDISLAPGGVAVTMPIPRRRGLGEGAWIDHQSGWLRRSDETFARLVAQVPWRAERRRMYDGVVDVPRMLAGYGPDEVLPDPVVAEAKQALDRHYAAELGEPFATVGLCLYRDGQDSVAWHGDTLGRSSVEDTMVAILSLGAPRVLALRPRERGRGEPVRLALGHGDLLVMGGSCQRTWEHAVPKTARPVGPRISLQFRPAGVA